MRVSVSLPIRRIANLFGAIAYSLLLFAYGLIIMGALLWMIQSGVLAWLGIEYQPTAIVPAADLPLEPRRVPPLVQLLNLLLTSLMLLTVIFVTITLPYWLARSGSNVLRYLIRLCRGMVTLRSLLVAKLLACCVGVVPVLIAMMYDYHTFPVALTELALLVVATMLFLLQHYLAETNATVQLEDIW